MNNDIPLRDYFAAAALQGLLADSQLDWDMEKFCVCAYKCADTMLEKRGNQDKKRSVAPLPSTPTGDDP